MKSAYYRVLKQSMGMTTDWIAENLNRNPRTISDFEAVKRTADVPDYIEEFMLEWWEFFQSEVEKIVTKIVMESSLPFAYADLRLCATQEQCDKYSPRPMTKQMYSALIGHVCMALQRKGIEVDVEFYKFD